MRAIIGAPGDSAGTLWANVLGVDDYERQVTVAPGMGNFPRQFIVQGLPGLTLRWGVYVSAGW